MDLYIIIFGCLLPFSAFSPTFDLSFFATSSHFANESTARAQHVPVCACACARVPPTDKGQQK